MKFLERFAHWLTATSFIILAVTGLNKLYGKYYLLPILGADLFSKITYIGKLSHNFIGFSFIFGIFMMFFMWIHQNIPNKKDIALINSMTRNDGWCKFFNKSNKTCMIYESRPHFCRVNEFSKSLINLYLILLTKILNLTIYLIQHFHSLSCLYLK